MVESGAMEKSPHRTWSDEQWTAIADGLDVGASFEQCAWAAGIDVAEIYDCIKAVEDDAERTTRGRKSLKVRTGIEIRKRLAAWHIKGRKKIMESRSPRYVAHLLSEREGSSAHYLPEAERTSRRIWSSYREEALTRTDEEEQAAILEIEEALEDGRKRRGDSNAAGPAGSGSNSGGGSASAA